jgi:Spy/CpxP family protein refolding chaperone
MKNAKIYKIIIAVLVALNLCTLAFMWFNRPGREGMGRHEGEAASFLVKELGLSDSQQKEYTQLRQEHHARLEALNQHDKDLHNRFFNLASLEKHDTISMDALSDSIAATRKKMEILTYDHFYRVMMLLNPEQQKKFNLIFKDVLRMILPPPPVPPPDLPPPPPPPDMQGMQNHRPIPDLPGLTDEQKTAIRKVDLAFMPQVAPLRKLIEADKAKLEALLTMHPSDVTQTDNVADEIGKTVSKLLKIMVQYDQSLRVTLSPDQQVIFDARPKPWLREKL